MFEPIYYAAGVFKTVQWLAVSGVFLYLSTLYIRRRKLGNLIDKIPGPKCAPFLGNIIQLGILSSLTKHFNTLEVLFQFRKGICQLYYKEKIFRVWIGSLPVVVFFHPHTLEALLSSNILIDKGSNYKFIESWIGKGLITSTGEKWRKQRKQLTPAFHFRILQDFLPIINDNVKILIAKLEKMCHEEWIDVIQPLTMCTLDIIGETAMGVPINSQCDKDSQYLKSVNEILPALWKRTSLPWLWPDFIFNRTETGKTYNKCVTHLHDFTRKVIREKKAEHLAKRNGTRKPETSEDGDVMGVKKRVAFLDLLMEMHLDGNQITEEEINQEVDTFMFAGHDTTAHGLMWSLYLIGRHPDVQEKIHEELDRVFRDDKTRPVTMADFSELKYLECVLKESLRILPVVPLMGRELSADLVVEGYTIPKGTNCVILPYETHKNPEFFPNPEIFDPDRFLPENSSTRHPYAYIPFSAGPRNCIGQRFAIMEEKAIISSLLRNFRIRSLDPIDKIHIVPEVILKPEPHMRIQFECR